MKSFVKKNSYKILNQYVDKNYFNDSCKNSIFKNIRLIAGSEIEKKVKAEGLEKIHNHFPVEYIPFLQFAIGQDLEKILYNQMYNVGVQNCKFGKSFTILQLLS